jgi:hypothetical protein
MPVPIADQVEVVTIPFGNVADRNAAGSGERSTGIQIAGAVAHKGIDVTIIPYRE